MRKNSPLIAPSILSADFASLKDQIQMVEQGGADWLHLDVMDGHFVPNITLGPPVIRKIRKVTALPLDTHLMIENPELYLDDFRSAGADVITVHQEVCHHLHRTISEIKALGAMAGVAINPATPVSSLDEIIGEVDLVLVMSVNPGFGGQSFIPSSAAKVRQVREMMNDKNSKAYLEVDGGIDLTTAPSVVGSGASVLVAGNYVFGSADIPAAVGRLREAAVT